MTSTAPLERLRELPSNSIAAIDEALSPAVQEQIEGWVNQAFTSSTRVVYLVGCGGSLFAYSPMRYLLDRSPVPTITMNAAEFVLRKPANLGPDSVVITASTNGGTAEVVDAIDAATAAGAPVLLVTGKADSLVGRATDARILHHGVEAKQLVLTALAQAICDVTAAPGASVTSTATMRAARSSFERVVDQVDEQLAAIARDLEDAPCIYVLGSGPLQGAAETLAACYLQEMQVRHAVAVGSGEFLHGPFEVTDGNLPVILLKNSGATRSMDQRTEDFLQRYNQRTHVIDVATFDVGLPEGAEADWIRTCITFTSVIARLAQHFESLSGRRLMDRRYMWTVDY